VGLPLALHGQVGPSGGRTEVQPITKGVAPIASKVAAAHERRWNMTIRLGRSALLSALALCIGSAAPAQITPTKDGWLFRVGMKPGQIARFELRAVTEGVPTGPQKNTMVFHLDCKSVTKGIATVHYALERDDEGEYDTKKTRLVLKMDRRGKAMWGKEPMTRLGVIFPEKPLKVGGTFPGQGVVSAGAFGQGKAADTYRFAGFVQHKGRRAARLEVSSDATVARGKASGSGAILVDPRDGLMVNMTYRHEAELVSGGKTIKIVQSVTADRL
jgi:hypothetical protein